MVLTEKCFNPLLMCVILIVNTCQNFRKDIKFLIYLQFWHNCLKPRGNFFVCQYFRIKT